MFCRSQALTTEIGKKQFNYNLYLRIGTMVHPHQPLPLLLLLLGDTITF